jgi:hypothetical protein
MAGPLKTGGYFSKNKRISPNAKADYLATKLLHEHSPVACQNGSIETQYIRHKSAALDVMPVIKDMTRCYHSEERTPATHGYIHVVGKLGTKIERPLLFRLLPR